MLELIAETYDVGVGCRQRDTAQQKEALELELLALRRSTGPGHGPIKRGSQVLLGASAEEAVPNSPSVAGARADRLQRQLEEAEQQIDAMAIKIQQQVLHTMLPCCMATFVQRTREGNHDSFSGTITVRLAGHAEYVLLTACCLAWCAHALCTL